MKKTIALATIAKSDTSGGSKPGTSNKTGGWTPGGHYTVQPWRLEYQGDTKKVNNREYHWCKEGHWSGGKEHFGMYVTHGPGEHAKWVEERDAERVKRFGKKKGTQNTPTPSDKPKAQGSDKQQLSLGESLRTALTTQAGLSVEAANRIWEESLRDSSKD